MMDAGKPVARTAVQDSLGDADAVAQIMASAISMRCLWLQSLVLPPEV